ncbi:MAG: type IV toxin-antitoxin system AbiEi family antitoxin domain-containing protein [Acidimicrobiia bacterium]|nr:type IV toxin-antitoxin system AbiEi family antitoxin domain-containing protein [Acidimicrobiia bacterium]
MESTTHSRLAALAAAQHGVFTRQDALALGVSDSALALRVAAGRYGQTDPGVYTMAGSVASVQQRMVVAVKSLPALAALSHQTAAEIWGLTQRGFRGIEVTTTRWDRVHRSAFRVHESLDLVAEDVVVRNGMPVTRPERTVVDLGASNRWIVESALERGIRLGLFSLGDVESFVQRVGRRGRRGVGVIRPLLEVRKRWDTATESDLEDLFRKFTYRADLPEPVTQYEVRTESGELISRSDFAYPEAALLIEMDSEAHHMDRITFRRDRSKQNSASVRGWTTLRYTWWDIKGEPERVAVEIRQALGNPSSSVVLA